MPFPPPDHADPMARLKEVMARLRDPEGGCPWDLEQDFATIAPYTIEEAYEVADAIESGNRAALKDELGDLLLQVVYHAQMAAEEGAFDFDQVAAAIADKMVRRHPHVFGDQDVADAAAQTAAWEKHKAMERAEGHGAAGALDGVARGLPALLRAQKLQKRAARAGFDWPAAGGALAKLREELDELAAEMNDGAAPHDARADTLEDELGDVLFSAVNLARKLDLDAEAALRRGNAKFERRFRRLEERMAAAGEDLEAASLDAMEARWIEAKGEEG